MTRPAVDIFIPFHGKYDLVSKCVESIMRSTPNQDFIVYLADDASPNKKFITPLKHRKLTSVQSEKQLGFGGILQEAYKNSRSPWIVIMHSDVTVANINWLLGLQRTMERLKHENIKLVTARTNTLGTSPVYDERILADQIEEDVVTTTAVPLFCALMHRDLFTKIGGFLKPYPYAYYEDEELFWRMKYFGYKQAISAHSYVNHVGGATIKELWAKKPSTKGIMDNNESKFLADIQPYLPQKTTEK